MTLREMSENENRKHTPTRTTELVPPIRMSGSSPLSRRCVRAAFSRHLLARSDPLEQAASPVANLLPVVHSDTPLKMAPLRSQSGSVVALTALLFSLFLLAGSLVSAARQVGTCPTGQSACQGWKDAESFCCEWSGPPTCGSSPFSPFPVELWQWSRRLTSEYPISAAQVRPDSSARHRKRGSRPVIHQRAASRRRPPVRISPAVRARSLRRRIDPDGLETDTASLCGHCAGVGGTYCVEMNPGWPTCPGGDEGRDPAASEEEEDSLRPFAGLHPAPRIGTTRLPTSYDKRAFGSDGDDIYDTSNDLLPTRPLPGGLDRLRPYAARPSAVSKLSELRLSPDWDVNAPPQRREYTWEIAEHPGSPDGGELQSGRTTGSFPTDRACSSHQSTDLCKYSDRVSQWKRGPMPYPPFAQAAHQRPVPRPARRGQQW